MQKLQVAAKAIQSGDYILGKGTVARIVPLCSEAADILGMGAPVKARPFMRKIERARIERQVEVEQYDTTQVARICITTKGESTYTLDADEEVVVYRQTA